MLYHLFITNLGKILSEEKSSINLEHTFFLKFIDEQSVDKDSLKKVLI